MAGSYQSALITAALRLSKLSNRGTPPKYRTAFSSTRMNVSVSWRSTTSL